MDQSTRRAPRKVITECEHAVYRLFDHDGVLLYVGMTSDIASRLRDHAARKDWWPMVDPSRTLLVTYSSRSEAFEAEAFAIETERPRIKCKSGRPLQPLTDEQRKRLVEARDEMEWAKDAYRDEVIEVLAEGASFAEVSRETGLSTNTLQRWKREAGS